MRTPPELDQFLRFLHARGLRITAERRALCEEIFEQHGHIDAEQVLAAARAAGHRISRATIYRNLELLVECGLVHKYRLGGRRFLYEHVHAGLQHHHLTCRRCRRVVEFVSPGIGAMLIEICRAHRFAVSTHELQILGLCNDCQALERRAEKPASG